MTTGLTYSTYVDQIATLAVVPSDDSQFQIILPQMITYAENRICRKMDFLFTVTTKTYTCTANTQSVSVPQTDFITLQEINIVTPYTTTNPALGTLNPCVPVTKEWLRWVYPSSASAGTPQYFTWIDNNNVLFGPWPDQNYTFTGVGTTRPDSLSATNTTTFISTYLPDVMIMASMIYISAFQRNFGNAAANDPEMGTSYESQFQALFTDAFVEEARKKFQASAWSPMSPAVAASPTR